MYKRIRDGWNYLCPTDHLAADSVTVVAVGDIMLGRRVGERLKSEDPCFPFLECRHVLRSGDILFGNLETPFSNRGTPILKQGPNIRSDPAKMAGLLEAGFSIVSLANNHIMDYGEEAFFDTLDALKRNGIHYVGAAKDKKTAEKPQIMGTGGKRIAFLAFADREESIASATRPGAAEIKPRRILKIITSLRDEVDFIIVSLHMGVEYSPFPSPGNVKLARKLIASGAHVILGHHPHVYQGVEVYKHGLIAYSLGNFIFDFDTQISTGGTNKSFILKTTLNKGRVTSFKVIPFQLNDTYQVEIIKGREREKFLRSLNRMSLALEHDEFLKDYWYILCNCFIADKFKWIVSRFSTFRAADRPAAGGKPLRKITPSLLYLKLAAQLRPLNRKLYAGFIAQSLRGVIGKTIKLCDDKFEGTFEERLSEICTRYNIDDQL